MGIPETFRNHSKVEYLVGYTSDESEFISKRNVIAAETIEFQKHCRIMQKGIGPNVTFVLVLKDKPVRPHV